MVTWLRRIGGVGVLLASLALIQQSGLAQAARTLHSGTDVTSIVPATKVLIFHPKGARGSAVNGNCGMGESAALDRTDAWRCIVGNIIYDPCFSTVSHATSVICAAMPGKPFGITVRLAQPLPTHAPAHDAQPWILVLGDGATCTFATGATFGVGGRRANYYCTDKDWLIGLPTTGRVWLAVKARISTKPSPNGPTASRLYLVSVATAWK